MRHRRPLVRIAVVAWVALAALVPQADAATLSYVSNPGRPIPDGDPFGSFDQIVVPDNGQILDVNVDLVVGHPFVEDLIVTVQHDGVLTELWLRACGPQQDMDLTFDDEGGAVVCATPIAGLIDPTSTTGGAGQLNVFDGLDVNGPWDIQVADVGPGGGNGVFIEWRLHVEVADPPVFVPPPDLREPGCRGADNPLYASPCRGGGDCAGVSDSGMSRRSRTGSRDHMSRMSSRASMLRASDDDSSDDSSMSAMDRVAGRNSDDMSMSMSSAGMDTAVCGGAVSSPGGVFRFSGEYHRTDVDMVIPGRGQDFVWSRTYRSRTGPSSPTGQNWDHGYNIRIFEIADGPSEAEQLVFPAKDQLVWQPPADAGGDPAALRYCTLRSDDVRDFAGPTSVVLDPEEADTATVDQQNPAPGQLFAYLILPKNGTRPGPLGTWSDGTPRAGLDCGLTGPDLVLADGTGRRDVYTQVGPLKWMAPEFLTVFTPNPDGSFTLTFPDTGQWNFRPPAGQPDDGKIDTIVDRNGNALTFTYDVAGNLDAVIDTLGRQIDLTYDPDGFLESLTDFTGRQVVYDYYEDGEAGGSAGDLKSVTTPIVTGTSTGNDFPNGKTTVYTYSTGFADEQLNHNLLTITDPKGQLWLENAYSPTLDPLQFDYDRVTSQTLGDPGDRIDFVYLPLVPDATNDFSTVRVIENDRVGNVSESFFDASNRMVRAVAFTGRAPDPDQPTGDTTNRPVNPLRIDDPPLFEMRWSYNDDARMTGAIFPNQSELQVVYDEFNPDRRSQANALSVCRTSGPLGGDQPQLCDLYEYDSAGPASAGTNFVTRHVDARGNESLHVYDAAGNREQTTHRIPSIIEDFEYNAFGQLTAYVHPDNGSGHRQRDEFFYYPTGPQAGYLQQVIVDFGNLDLTTAFEYDPRGNVVRAVDPRGADTLLEVNQLDQVVRATSREVEPGTGLRYETATYYDANDNVVRVDVENRDENGVLDANPFLTTVHEYDILDRVTQTCTESGVFTGPIPGPPELPTCLGLPPGGHIFYVYEYDDNRNLTLFRDGASTDGSQPTNTVTHVYDERDLLFETVRAAGDPDQSSTRYDYDANGNLRRVSRGIEDTPRVHTMEYDGYDRLLQVTDPLENVTLHTYDPNGNVVHVRSEGELVDVPGNAGNVRLSESTYVYDVLDRQVRVDTLHFDGDTQTMIGDGVSSVATDYTDSSRVRSVTDDNSNTTNFVYDTANRLLLVEDAKSNEQLYEYDGNSNVLRVTSTERSDLGTPDEVFVTTSDYDGLDRVVSTVDNAGNEQEWRYDSRGNVRVTLDATNGSGVSGNVTRMEYDGVDRLVTTTRELTVDGTGGTTPFDDIVLRRGYDSSSRLVELVDDAGNVTTYEYDALDRRTVELSADGTLRSTDYDVHDNVEVETDPNGTTLVPTYDLLDRMVHLDVIRGPGVGGATFEDYDYDGLSRVVRASDDDSTVLRGYDSLSNTVRESLDGLQTQSFHDGDGNRIQSIYPGGRVLEYGYDGLNRMTSIQDGPAAVATYQYIGPSRVQRRVYGNGAETLYTYDGIANPPGDSGVKQIVRTQHIDPAGTTFDDRVYAWDPMGNKIRHEDVTPNGPATLLEYVYDSVYRMTSSTRSSPFIPTTAGTYVFDGVGNRSSVSGGPDPGSYVLDPTSPVPADEQVNQYTVTPFDERVYDDNGNTTGTTDLFGLPTVVHVYDYADRLVERNDPGAGLVTTYDYDAIGRRIRRTVTDPAVSTETRYYYDGHRVCEERAGAGATTATYVYGLYVDEVLEREHSLFGTSYFHTDDLYNTVAVTDATGGVRERVDYQDYGQPIFLDAFGNPQPRSFLQIPYLFTGRRYDDESGLYWFRTRYLDPRAGRFTSRDSIGAWGDPGNHGNGQTYAGNNPATMVDPFGDVPLHLSHQGRLMDSSGTPMQHGGGVKIRRGATIGGWGATIGSGTRIGRGRVIGDHSKIESGVRIGRRAIIGNDNTFGHGTVIGRRASVGSGASVGTAARIGRNSTVGNYAEIGEGAVIRAGLQGGGGGGGGRDHGTYRGHAGSKKDKGRRIAGGGGGGGAIWPLPGHWSHTIGGGTGSGMGTIGTRFQPAPQGRAHRMRGRAHVLMGPIYVLQPATAWGGGGGGGGHGGRGSAGTPKKWDLMANKSY